MKFSKYMGTITPVSFAKPDSICSTKRHLLIRRARHATTLSLNIYL